MTLSSPPLTRTTINYWTTVNKKEWNLQKRYSTSEDIKNENEIAQLCPTLCDPMDCSPSGFSIHGIFQARVLEWVAISFSNLIVWVSLIWPHSTSPLLYVITSNNNSKKQTNKQPQSKNKITFQSGLITEKISYWEGRYIVQNNYSSKFHPQLTHEFFIRVFM